MLDRARPVIPMQLSREIDWVMKLHLLTNYMERRESGWDDPRIAMMDLQYHDIRPEKGLYYVLERRSEPGVCS